jgi:hypothetical protein
MLESVLPPEPSCTEDEAFIISDEVSVDSAYDISSLSNFDYDHNADSKREEKRINWYNSIG